MPKIKTAAWIELKLEIDEKRCKLPYIESRLAGMSTRSANNKTRFVADPLSTPTGTIQRSLAP
jgi:hypothetical protein